MNTTAVGGVRITYFGHASVCLEFDGKTVYVDPYLLGRGARPADLILHTHAHFDHCALPAAILKPATTIVGKGCKHPGRPIEAGEKMVFGPIGIEAVPAYNIDKPYHPRGAGCGFLLSFGPSEKAVRIYVAGDTDYIPEMGQIKCDLAFLPIGGKYTMDAADAARASVVLKPKIIVPYHYNYMSDTQADPLAFKRKVAELMPGVDVRILTP